ncbi:MAG: SAM-dependent methyltransferase, partial [Candidatus Geothermincolia bacterium]
CAARGLSIEVIPGASSVTAAVALAGFPVSAFVFEGYLPNRTGARRARLLELSRERRPVVFFEAPQRISETLEDLETILGQRPLVLLRELTKLHEEVLRGDAARLRSRLGEREGRGEFTVLLGPAAPEQREASRDQLVREVEELLADGVARNDAFKLVAASWGIAKRAVYDAYLEARKRKG